MPKSIQNAKIALLDFNLQRHRMQLGVQVLVTDPAKLEAIRQREADITKEKIQKIIAAGACCYACLCCGDASWLMLPSHASRAVLAHHFTRRRSSHPPPRLQAPT